MLPIRTTAQGGGANADALRGAIARVRIKQNVATPAVAPISEPEPEKKKKAKDEDEDDMHPFIKGLLKKLPTPETEWPSEGRAKWLQAAINIFDLMYTDSEDKGGHSLSDFKRILQNSEMP